MSTGVLLGEDGKGSQDCSEKGNGAAYFETYSDVGLIGNEGF